MLNLPPKEVISCLVIPVAVPARPGHTIARQAFGRYPPGRAEAIVSSWPVTPAPLSPLGLSGAVLFRP